MKKIVELFNYLNSKRWFNLTVFGVMLLTMLLFAYDQFKDGRVSDGWFMILFIVVVICYELQETAQNEYIKLLKRGLDASRETVRKQQVIINTQDKMMDDIKAEFHRLSNELKEKVKEDE